MDRRVSDWKVVMIDLQLLSLMVVGEYNYGVILFALKLLLYLRIAVMVDMYFSK